MRFYNVFSPFSFYILIRIQEVYTSFLIPVNSMQASECVGSATLCNIFGSVSQFCRLVQTMYILSFLYFPIQFLRYGSLIVLTTLDRVASTCAMASCPPLCLSLYLSLSCSADRGFTLGAFLRNHGLRGEIFQW